MRTPYIFLASLLSIVIMALSMHNSYAVPTTPPPNGYTGGLFSVYFNNMVEGTGATTPGSYITSTNGLCPTGRGIVGFYTGSNVFYGTPICGQVSSPQYWTSNDGGSTIYFTGAGNVGIGTSNPMGGLHIRGGSATLYLQDPLRPNDIWSIDHYSDDGRLAFILLNGAGSPIREVLSLGLSGDARINGVTVGLGNNSIATNTAIGRNTLRSHTTGWSNTAIGNNALYSNTTGYYNVSVGDSSLLMNLGGAQNTAIGGQALQNNIEGQNNTAIGMGSLNSNTASSNTAIGAWALRNNITGTSNTANGLSSLYNNSIGSENTANGHNSLYSNTIGSRNTAVGITSLYSNISGDNNTAIGVQSLQTNTVGGTNTAVGRLSLFGNTTGGGNTAIGYAAGSNVTSGGNNIAIGSSAQVPSATASNQLNIGNWIYGQNGVIGIGTATGLTLTDGASKGLIIESGKDNVSGLRLDSLSQSRAPTTITSTIFGTTGAGPAGITIDSAGNVYTTNLNSNTVTKITPTGVSTTLGTTGAGPSEIAIDSAGNVYTANANSNNVTKITPAGVSTTLGTTGAGPTGIAIDSAGNVYTANRNANNVTKITPAGVSTTLGTTGAYPTSIIIDSAGNVYTTNWSSSTITKITPAGVSTTFVSGPGASGPSGIVMDSAGNLYVGISGDRISKINSTGGYTILGNTGAFPSTCAVDATGNVYTTNWNSNNVTKTTPAGVSTTFGPVSLPGGCAVDTAGNLYVTSFNSNNVTKFTQSPPQSQRYLSIDGMGNVTTNNNLNSSIVFSGGNIGIGTSSPGAKLEVAGQVKITGGAPGAGKVLTSDANGLASWQTATSISGPANRFPVWDSGGSLFTGSILTQTYNQNTTTNYMNNNFKYGVGLTYGPDLYKYVMNGGYDVGWGGNMYIGGAGNWSSSGSMNVALGAWSMWRNTSGSNNAVFGWGSLGGNNGSSGPQSGNGNTVMGAQSLGWVSTASYNSALGGGVLANLTTGNYNVGIGNSALSYNISGSNNIAVGPMAGNTITSGSNNIAIGYNAQVPSATASNQLNIGNWIYGNNGNIGIGTSSPGSNKLQVDGNFLATNNNSASSYPFRVQAIWNNSSVFYEGIRLDVTDNASAPSARLLSLYSGGDTKFSVDKNGNIAFAGGKGGLNYYNPSPYNQIELGTPSGSNIDVSFHTNGISRMWIKPNGNVGIGVHVPSYLLHVAGTAGGTSWTNTSDIRLKKNIETLPTSSLETLSLVRPVSFDWKDSKDEYMKTRQYGFIAQEVEKVYPNLVTTANDEIKTKSVNYDGFIPLLVSSIQELKKENNALKQKNLELEKRIEAIEANLY